MPTVIRRQMLTPHFSESELACRCRRPDCAAPDMDMDFMHLLEALRVAWGKPLTITSGARCLVQNTLVGGAPNSQHLLGRAVDLWLDTGDEVELVAELAEKLGFGGIGRGQYHLCHVDSGKAGRRWEYPSK